MVLPWFLCGVLTTVVLALLVKIRRLHTSLDEIGTQLGERLEPGPPIPLSAFPPAIGTPDGWRPN